MRRFLLYLACILTMFIFLQYSFAAQIKAVKGTKVLVDMESDSFNEGDILKVQNSAGKTVGLIKVMKTKGALAEGILKGKAQKGFRAKLRPPKGSNSSSGATAKRTSGNSSDKLAFGFMVGYNSTSAEIKLPTTPTATAVSLSGSGFSLKGIMDYPLLSWLNFRGLIGLEQFNVGGESNTAVGGCGGECTAEINYLTFDMWGRYLFSHDGFRPWIGLGFELMFPISKSATALDESSITNTSTSPAAFGAGADWQISQTSYVPIQIEYVPYPSTDDVKAGAIAAKIGYSFSF